MNIKSFANLWQWELSYGTSFDTENTQLTLVGDNVDKTWTKGMREIDHLKSWQFIRRTSRICV